MWVVTITRISLTCLLIYLAHQETGEFTTLALVLLFLYVQVVGIELRSMQKELHRSRWDKWEQKEGRK